MNFRQTKSFRSWLWGMNFGTIAVRFSYWMGWDNIDPFQTAHPWVSLIAAILIGSFVTLGIILFDAAVFGKEDE